MNTIEKDKIRAICYGYDQSKGIFRKIFGDHPAIKELKQLTESNELLDAYDLVNLFYNHPPTDSASYFVFIWVLGYLRKPFGSDGRSLARTLDILNQNNLLTKENFYSLCNHGSSDLVFIHGPGELLTQQNNAHIPYDNLRSLSESVSILNSARILSQSNFDLLIDRVKKTDARQIDNAPLKVLSQARILTHKNFSEIMNSSDPHALSQFKAEMKKLCDEYDSKKGIFRKIFGDHPAIQALKRELNSGNCKNYSEIIELFNVHPVKPGHASYDVLRKIISKVSPIEGADDREISVVILNEPVEQRKPEHEANDEVLLDQQTVEILNLQGAQPDPMQAAPIEGADDREISVVILNEPVEQREPEHEANDEVLLDQQTVEILNLQGAQPDPVQAAGNELHNALMNFQEHDRLIENTQQRMENFQQMMENLHVALIQGLQQILNELPNLLQQERDREEILAQGFQQINWAQSTHTDSVHKSASESAKKLLDRYGAHIEGDGLEKIITEIKDFINKLYNDVVSASTKKLISDCGSHIEGNSLENTLIEIENFINKSFDEIFSNFTNKLKRSPETYQKFKDLIHELSYGSSEQTQALKLSDSFEVIKKAINDDESFKNDPFELFNGWVENLSAKICIERLSKIENTFVDPITHVSTKQLLALTFLAINDDKIRKGNVVEAKQQFVSALYAVQKDYDINPIATNITYTEAIFNKLFEKVLKLYYDHETLLTPVSVKTCIERITSPIYAYTDPSSNISMRQLLALTFLGIQDETRRNPECNLMEAKNNYVQALYEIQRGYNLVESEDSKTLVENLKPDEHICGGGAFNKLINGLQGVQLDCKIINVTIKIAGYKLSKVTQEEAVEYLSQLANRQNKNEFNELINQIKKDGIENIWENIKEKIANRMFDEFGSLFPKGLEDVGFIAFIEAGKDTVLNNAALDELKQKNQNPPALPNDITLFPSFRGSEENRNNVDEVRPSL